MTREEAIKHLKSSLRVTYTDETRQAFIMGIEALEQPQIVRCKDCRFSILIPPCNQRKCDGAMEKIVSDDFFCASAEWKDK